MPPTHVILCHAFLLPSIFPSIRVFSDDLALCIRWPKYWSFSFSISPSNEYSGLISFGTDWISLQSKGLSRVFSNTTVQKHQFFGAQLSFRFLPYINMNQQCPLPLEHPCHLPPPIPSHPSRLSQNMGLSFLSHTTHSHWKSTLHMVMYMFPCNSLHHLQLLKKFYLFIYFYFWLCFSNYGTRV